MLILNHYNIAQAQKQLLRAEAFFCSEILISQLGTLTHTYKHSFYLVWVRIHAKRAYFCANWCMWYYQNTIGVCNVYVYKMQFIELTRKSLRKFPPLVVKRVIHRVAVLSNFTSNRKLGMVRSAQYCSTFHAVELLASKYIALYEFLGSISKEHPFRHYFSLVCIIFAS